MIEIKAGFELDLAVARAAGFEVVDSRPMDDEVWVVNPSGRDSRMIAPSADLNAACAAAEKAGLFDGGPQDVHLGMTNDKRWEILIGATGYQGVIGGTVVCGEMGYVSREPTPALAICAAILKLKEKSDDA